MPYIDHPSIQRDLIPNSSLTLDGKYEDPFISTADGSIPSPKQPTSELEGARARLRPIQERKDRDKGKAPDNPTMAELGYLLESAIIEQSSEASPAKGDTASLRSPTSRSRSVRASERSGRSAAAYTRPGTSSTQYPSSSPLKAPPPFGFTRSPPLSLVGLESKSRAHSSASMAMPERCSSPVKERAALIDSLYFNSQDTQAPSRPPPRAHLHTKDGWVAIPRHDHTPEKESKFHRLKFGQSVDLHANELGAQPSSRETEAYETAQESAASPAKRIPSRNDHRAPSRGWPSNTQVSSKTGLSYPQPNEEAAPPQMRDSHHPPARPSIVAQRIAQLALAGLESEQIPSRSYSAATSRSRQTSQHSALVTEGEIREHALNGSRLRPSQLPPLQVPVQEEADLLRSDPKDYRQSTPTKNSSHGAFRGRDGPQSPLSLAMHEKQVTHPLQPSLVKEEQGGPLTPFRGRGATRRTPRSSGYGVEQGFYFSPDRSRSRSKASGRRLTLEINMGTPDRDDMEKVVIKADMAVLDEE